MLTPEQITEIRERLEKIEPGQWVVLVDGDPLVHVGGICENTGTVICECWETKHSQKKDNAEFIAHASEDVCTLLAALDEAEGVIQHQKSCEEQLIQRMNMMVSHEVLADRDRWKARCEAMERAIKGYAYPCFACTKMNEPCKACAFEFDEARFASKAGDSDAD